VTLDRWDDLVERYALHKGRFMKWQARLTEYLDGTHGQVCEALETLGTTLGFKATRPGGDGAADGIWSATDHVVTLEAKINLEKRDFIALSDVNQADGHRRAVETAQQLASGQVASVLVTGVEKIDPTAEKALGTIRVLHLDQVHEVQQRLEAIMREYWKGWTHDAAKRKALRAAAAQKLPPTGWLLRAIHATAEPFIESDVLFMEWPQ
jgi:hypothetical protein